LQNEIVTLQMLCLVMTMVPDDFELLFISLSELAETTILIHCLLLLLLETLIAQRLSKGVREHHHHSPERNVMLLENNL
jgi:hypothetical protein